MDLPPAGQPCCKLLGGQPATTLHKTQYHTRIRTRSGPSTVI